MSLLGLIIFVIFIVAFIGGMIALDSWHTRYARRQARRYAERIMRQRNGDWRP